LKTQKEIVKEIIKEYISEKPSKIVLIVNWESGYSDIIFHINGEKVQRRIYERISFTSFGLAVKEAYEEAYGNLETIPISFREEEYKNQKVKLHFYPTGSAGVFDIYVNYAETP